MCVFHQDSGKNNLVAPSVFLKDFVNMPVLNRRYGMSSFECGHMKDTRPVVNA